MNGKEFNFKVLNQLAQAEPEDEFSENLSSMPEELRQALNDEKAAQRKETMAEAARTIIGIFKDSDTMITQQIGVIRIARAKEAEAKDKIKKIERAKKYAQETNNYLPLAKLTGYFSDHHLVNPQKFEVPDDWVPRDQSAQRAKKK